MALTITAEVPTFIANEVFTTRWIFVGDTPISGEAISDWILRRTDGSFTNLSSSNTTLTRVGTTDSYDLTITLTGTIDADYGVRLRPNRIQDSLGGSFPPSSITSMEFRVRTDAPSPPQNLMLTAGDGQITATWETPSDTGGGSLQYQISTDGTNYTDASAILTETVTGLTNGTMYTVYLRAVSGSAAGSPVTATATPMEMAIEAGSLMSLGLLQSAEYNDVVFPLAIPDAGDATESVGRRAGLTVIQDLITTAARFVEQAQALNATQLATVQSLIGGNFDLFADVDDQTTSLDDNDRFLVADVSETGEPNRYVEVSDLSDTFGSTVTNVLNVFNTFTTEQVEEARASLGLMLEPTIGSLGTHALASGNTASTGITYISTIDEVWTVDVSDDDFFRYSTSGGSLGTHALHSNNGNPSGVAYISTIDEVWVVDDSDDDIYRYNTSGGSLGTHALASGNTNPQGITYVSDIDEVWVVDSVFPGRIYRYNTSGGSLGTHPLESANVQPSGITYVSDIDEVWVVDVSNPNRIYRYNTSGGSLGTFSAGNSSQGIGYIADIDEVWLTTTSTVLRYAVLFDITLTPARISTILQESTAAQRNDMRIALGLQGANLTVTAYNNRSSGNYDGEIIIAKENMAGGNFTVTKGRFTPTTSHDIITIDYM